MRRLDEKTLEEITGGVTGGLQPWDVIVIGGGFNQPGYSDFGRLNAILTANEMGIPHIPYGNNLKQ